MNYEQEYPYVGYKQMCWERSNTLPNIIQTVLEAEPTENSLLQKLNYSPVIIGVYASSAIWMHYKSGIITARDCNPLYTINHAVNF